MSSAKKRRETIRRNEAILAARPKTANGAKRTDKTEGVPNFLRRYRDRYATMPHRKFSHGKIGGY
jgi:hypothetical protein